MPNRAVSTPELLSFSSDEEYPKAFGTLGEIALGIKWVFFDFKAKYRGRPGQTL